MPDKEGSELAAEKYQALADRVNKMLDLPLPAQIEAWSPRFDTSQNNIPPGRKTEAP